MASNLRESFDGLSQTIYEGVKMYNSLPANIKQSDRLQTFKQELKEYYIFQVG